MTIDSPYQTRRLRDMTNAEFLASKPLLQTTQGTGAYHHNSGCDAVEAAVWHLNSALHA